MIFSLFIRFDCVGFFFIEVHLEKILYLIHRLIQNVRFRSSKIPIKALLAINYSFAWCEKAVNP